MKKHSVTPLIPEETLRSRVFELGTAISERYRIKGENYLSPSDQPAELLLISLLRGSFVFTADLCRCIKAPHQVDFMMTSSYGNKMSTSGNIQILKDLNTDVSGKDLLIVEDIIDTGYTLRKVIELLSVRGPKSLTICTLLDKPSRREIDIPVDYIGFSIPDEFVVGYGIDYSQQYRHLPYIGKVVIEADERK